ncbi:winged helix-turn-helix domain-containing protein [Arundinibacter roseus]|uniref:Response regulator transcription factor n=1 Tax=Arundinibacter roseus TaxID=2070510 RepID=A0A4R4KH15_9BACT|nr:winged helix-turn-helix domain-containing protein [Arundinibacter roseus]TDB65911.1 response regulator transcription factor [Arundinibacter roseus]
MVKKRIVFGSLWLLMFCTGNFLLAASEKELAPEAFAQHVNLALRRTAHGLLLAQGDSTSAIAPVQNPQEGVFTIQLEKAFEYDRIPQLLQESLTLHHISEAYDVAVLNCNTKEIALGYTFLDLAEPEGVPCNGRIQESGCYVLQISFQKATPTKADTGAVWAGALGILLAGAGALVWYRGRQKTPEQPESDKHLISFGQTTFNPAEQTLVVAGMPHALTYREAKLLRLFALHPNQLLERDFILKSVWEDEGISVGRSVDVFVSRLRKLLQHDSTLRIASVHGVGYRLEVAA